MPMSFFNLAASILTASVVPVSALVVSALKDLEEDSYLKNSSTYVTSNTFGPLPYIRLIDPAIWMSEGLT